LRVGDPLQPQVVNQMEPQPGERQNHQEPTESGGLKTAKRWINGTGLCMHWRIHN
jgi:hypothetical protein